MRDRSLQLRGFGPGAVMVLLVWSWLEIFVLGLIDPVFAASPEIPFLLEVTVGMILTTLGFLWCDRVLDFYDRKLGLLLSWGSGVSFVAGMRLMWMLPFDGVWFAIASVGYVLILAPGVLVLFSHAEMSARGVRASK